MKRVNLKALIFLPLALIGPAIMTWMMWAGKSRPSNILPFVAIACVSVAITAIAAIIVRLKYPAESLIALKIMVVSYIISAISILPFILKDPFAIIGAFFAPIYATPTIITFSIFWSSFLPPTKDIKERKI